MANEMQRGNLTGTAIMRMPISGTVSIGGKQMKELRFMPYSEFPETGREETLYIDTDGNALYYYDGTSYVALSGGGGGGTGDYNELSNKPQINGQTLSGNKTAANLGLQETISDLAAIRSGAASGSTAVQPATLATALATKQDVISDISSIRSGAASGATAVQPDDLEAALSDKQDTISDLQTIRSGAALGATAVQPSDMETALADKQDVINDLDAIRSGATAGNTALQPEDIDPLPTDGSSNPVSSGGTYDFVNSSIATNTAYFIGTFASVAELEAYSGTVTNNDYAFVTSTDSAGNTLYNRYKYNAATLVWSFEYAVNNTAFTTAQWAAIQSGMTSADKTKLDGIEQGANKTVIDTSPTSGSSNAVSSGGVHTALSGKQDTISDLSDIRSGASAGATAVQPSALTDYQTKLSGTNKLDPSYIDYDASHRAVSDTEKSTWNGKQDTISDLDTIRSGASAGATALQQSNVTSTYSSSGTAPVNGTAVNAAIGTLDVSSVGGSGKYLSAISETNGKIAATPTTFDTVLSSSSTNNNAPTSKTVFDDQARQDAEIAWNVNQGVKNLLNPKLKSKTVDGVTYTLQSDGCIIANGTAASALVVASFYGGQFTLPAGDWLLNGCPSGGSTNSYMVQIKDNSHPENPADGVVLYRDFGSGDVAISINQDTTFMYVVRIVNGYTANNVVIKPMIRPAAITDTTYQPYTLPNPTLTPAVIKAVDEGAKNRLKVGAVGVGDIYGTTYENNGVTYTLNSDGTVSLSGTASAESHTNLRLSNGSAITIDDFCNGNYVLSGCPSGGRGVFNLRARTADNAYILFDIGSGVTLTNRGAYSDILIGIFVQGGKDCTGLTFSPMICTKAEWDISQAYVPYAPTNRELYEMIQALQNNS